MRRIPPYDLSESQVELLKNEYHILLAKAAGMREAWLLAEQCRGNWKVCETLGESWQRGGIVCELNGQTIRCEGCKISEWNDEIYVQYRLKTVANKWRKTPCNMPVKDFVRLAKPLKNGQGGD